MENKVVQQIHKYLKERGWFQVNLMHISPSGIPDRLIYKDERYVWLEIKRPDGRLSDIQKHRIYEMQNMGMEVHVIFSLDDLKRIL